MEIVVRAAVVYLFLWLVTRVVGRSTLGELSTFQLLLYVCMGDLVQQAVTQQDYSVTGGALAVGTFAVITVAVSYVNRRWRLARPITHGVPVCVVRDGEPQLEALAGEQLSFGDLTAAAREQGIRRLSDIEMAVLEADGKVSFFVHEQAASGAPERPPAAGG
jgi:uncharacterized membrane protein YcaP (DUF421 family)